MTSSRTRERSTCPSSGRRPRPPERSYLAWMWSWDRGGKEWPRRDRQRRCRRYPPLSTQSTRFPLSPQAASPTVAAWRLHSCSVLKQSGWAPDSSPRRGRNPTSSIGAASSPQMAPLRSTRTASTEDGPMLRIVYCGTPHWRIGECRPATASSSAGRGRGHRLVSKRTAVPAVQRHVPVEGLEGRLDLMALYAGQSVGLVHDVRSAAEIVGEIVADARRSLTGWGVPVPDPLHGHPHMRRERNPSCVSSTRMLHGLCSQDARTRPSAGVSRRDFSPRSQSGSVEQIHDHRGVIGRTRYRLIQSFGTVD